MPPLARGELARHIEHTLLRPDAGAREVEALCAEACKHLLYGVCVNGCRVELARHLLEETDVKIVCAVGFPLGASETDAKRVETEAAIDNGAHEIDVALNLGWLRDGAAERILRELRDLVEAADERPVKVILETALLRDEEKVLAARLVVASGAKFVVTSSGFAPGATPEDVRLLREAVGPKFGIKASGGIREAAQAQALIEAGATRLGCSASVAVVSGLPE
jgi:deoxyribose-phosphate aldolase